MSPWREASLWGGAVTGITCSTWSEYHRGRLHHRKLLKIRGVRIYIIMRVFVYREYVQAVRSLPEVDKMLGVVFTSGCILIYI